MLALHLFLEEVFGQLRKIPFKQPPELIELEFQPIEVLTKDASIVLGEKILEDGIAGCFVGSELEDVLALVIHALHIAYRGVVV